MFHRRFPTVRRPAALAGALLSLCAVNARSGSLDAPAGPNAAGSALYTLESLYNRLDTGAAGSKRGATFAEPAAEPAPTMYDLDALMAKMPAVDATNGAAPGDVISGKTYWGLTEAGWGLQTGTGAGGGASAAVPKTGQTPTVPLDPAPAGSDGALQKGVAWPNPRFTDNGNGTVTDHLSGLIWLKNANCTDTVGGVSKASGKLTWADALTWSNALAHGSCGLTDGSAAGAWRLPNYKELVSLLDIGYANPALSNAAGTAKWSADDAFSGVVSDYYWSSSSMASYTSSSWTVGFNLGEIWYGDKTAAYYVWPARGGQ
jgi:hypothetical protein